MGWLNKINPLNAALKSDRNQPTVKRLNNEEVDMLVEIKVPNVGESVTEAVLAQWFKSDGDPVKKDEPLFVIETDKVTLEVVAEADGVLAIKVREGETIAIGAVVGTIDTEAAAEKAGAPAAAEAQATKETAPKPETPPEPKEEKPAPDKAPPEPRKEKPSDTAPAAATAETDEPPAPTPGQWPSGPSVTPRIWNNLGRQCDG